MTLINKILTSFFCVFLISIMVLSAITPDIAFSENENRYLTQLPNFSLDSLVSGEFTKQFEEYVTDQIIKRDLWVGMKAALEYLAGKKENNGVYFGKDGFLIDIQDNIDYSKIDKNLNYIDIFSQEIKKPLYFLTVPDTDLIYDDKLPKHADNSERLNAYQYIKEKISSIVNYVDSLETLLHHKNDYLYYRTDHHFTTLGAYYTYAEIVKGMDIIPFEQDDFEIKTVSENFYGTMFSKAKAYWVKPDLISVYNLNDSYQYKVYINDGGETKKLNNLYSWEALNEKDQYRVFLDGNHSQVIVKSNVQSDKNVLVLKDSFAHSVVPFLANHFNEIHMLDLRYYKSNIVNYVEENNIDEVIVLYSLSSFCETTDLSWLNP